MSLLYDKSFAIIGRATALQATFHHAQRQDCAEICHPLVGYVFMGSSNELSRSSTGKEGDTIGRCCEYMHVNVCTSCTSDCYFCLPTSPDDAVVSGN